MKAYSPVKWGFLLFRNADVPSLKSAVPKQAPKASISSANPSTPGVSPAFIARMACAMAFGAFRAIFSPIFLQKSKI